MMDILTIILLFLLKNFSASGALMTPAPGIQLPESIADVQPEKSLMVYILPSKGMILDQEGRAFEEMPLISSTEELATEGDVLLPGLESLIIERQANNSDLNLPPLTEMTIQADEAVPYAWILKVVQTASSAGISKFDFVVSSNS